MAMSIMAMGLSWLAAAPARATGPNTHCPNITPVYYTLIDCSDQVTWTSVYPGGAVLDTDNSYLVMYQLGSGGTGEPLYENAADLLAQSSYSATGGTPMCLDSSGSGFDPGPLQIPSGPMIGTYSNNVGQGTVWAQNRSGGAGTSWCPHPPTAEPYVCAGADAGTDPGLGSDEASDRRMHGFAYVIYASKVQLTQTTVAFSVHARSVSASEANGGGCGSSTDYSVVTKCDTPTPTDGTCTGNGPNGHKQKRSICASSNATDGVICVWNSYNLSSTRQIWARLGTETSGSLTFTSAAFNITGSGPTGPCPGCAAAYGSTCTDQYNPFAIRIASTDLRIYFTCDGSVNPAVVKSNDGGSSWVPDNAGGGYSGGYFTLPGTPQTGGPGNAARMVLVQDSVHANRVVMLGSWQDNTGGCGNCWILGAWQA